MNIGESVNQTRFFDGLLAKYPRLEEFWDRERREFNDIRAKKQMGVLSSGEKVVLKALASIWMGSSNGKFDLNFSDVADLSPSFRKPLVEWLINPWWP